jgi:hypothetical protein
MKREISSLIDQEVGHIFALERLDGSKIAIPMIHLDFFKLEGSDLELKFSYHTIVISALSVNVLFDILITGKGVYVKEFGDRFESLRKPDSLYILKADITEIER